MSFFTKDYKGLFVCFVKNITNFTVYPLWSFLVRKYTSADRRGCEYNPHPLKIIQLCCCGTDCGTL